MKTVIGVIALAGSLVFAPLAWTAETIKVGVLHSLSGTMAISETTLKDTVLMMIDQQNKAGGLLGRQLEAVVVDPASNWPLFAEKARALLAKDKVDVVFGPAYKGIPLAVATAQALAREHDMPVSYAYNRKEAKKHGDGGAIIGAKEQEAISVNLVAAALGNNIDGPGAAQPGGSVQG